MKMICKRVLVCVLAVLVLITATACAPSFKEPSAYVDLPAYYNAGTDFPMTFSNPSVRPITAMEKGYFCFNGICLTFFDKETLKSSVVCNRPECMHESETCAAVFDRSYDSFMQCYEDKLYVAANEYDENYVYSSWLYEVNTSDCTRRKLCQLPYGGNDMVSYMMHRGYLYMTAYIIKPDESPKLRVERVALTELAEKSLTPELLYENETITFRPPHIFGDRLFVTYSQYGTIGMDMLWTEINLKTGETNDIDMSEMEEGTYWMFDVTYQDKMLATYVDLNAYLEGSREMNYYSYDSDTGQFEPFLTIPDRGEGCYDYFAWDGKNGLTYHYNQSSLDSDVTQELRILDENFETVKRVSLDCDVDFFLIGDENFSFFESIEDNTPILHAIDKRGEELKIVKVFE